MIRKGKTDQKRDGRKVAVPYGKHSETCPVIALTDWLEASKIYSGAIFRAVTSLRGQEQLACLTDQWMKMERNVVSITNDRNAELGDS